MLITDLSHFLDLSPDAPGPARRLAEHLGGIVRAAAAGDQGAAWVSALPCRRRPGNRRCAGRLIVRRTDVGAPIRWQCSVCDDEGTISTWEDSPFDLRRRSLAAVDPVHEVVLSDEVAAALRELQLLDLDGERVVFRMCARPGGGAILGATEPDLEALLDSLAAEANHEPNRRRQQRLDAAFIALRSAARTVVRE